MSTDLWQPAVTKAEPLSQATLLHFAKHALDAANVIQQADYQGCAYVMKQPLSYWQKATESLQDEHLWPLIQFFSLAEEASSEWFAGELSPAIHLNKIAKARGHKLQKEQLIWIRENSSNRFIPNGPITL